MFMAPDSWKGLYASTLAQAKSGEIPMTRLDDAVRRILRVKLRAHLFDKGAPVDAAATAGNFELLGAPEHRAVARQAVRESLVLLKNDKQLLPLSPEAATCWSRAMAPTTSRKQSGGWTITWQGTGLTNVDFPHAQSIWSGIDEAVRAAGGKAVLSADGSFTVKPDAAIVVFGEEPYAEFVGDRPRSLEYSPADKKDLELLRKLKAAGIPTVSIFLSGRPMWVNPELNATDAFVAAFLPGGEGGGVADVSCARPTAASATISAVSSATAGQGARTRLRSMSATSPTTRCSPSVTAFVTARKATSRCCRRNGPQAAACPTACCSGAAPCRKAGASRLNRLAA